MFLKLPFAVSISVLFITIQYAVVVNHLECFTYHYEFHIYIYIYIYVCVVCV